MRFGADRAKYNFIPFYFPFFHRYAPLYEMMLMVTFIEREMLICTGMRLETELFCAVYGGLGQIGN